MPGGLVAFTFADEAQLQAAQHSLKSHYTVERGGDLVLTIAAGEGTKRLAELFIRLRDAHIEPADFSQKPPTLDDVFFKMTGEKQEDK